MYGQKISFVGRFGLQATFISFVTISIVLTLAKSVLPATPRRWQKRREAEKPRATRRYARMLS